MKLPILYFKGSQVELSELKCISVIKMYFFIFANTADTDEMLLYAAYHLGLHYIPKYTLIGIKNEKGKYISI